jgi:hypothetical protein
MFLKNNECDEENSLNVALELLYGLLTLLPSFSIAIILTIWGNLARKTSSHCLEGRRKIQF